jgi:hypothetical protein
MELKHTFITAGRGSGYTQRPTPMKQPSSFEELENYDAIKEFHKVACDVLDLADAIENQVSRLDNSDKDLNDEKDIVAVKDVEIRGKRGWEETTAFLKCNLWEEGYLEQLGFVAKNGSGQKLSSEVHDGVTTYTYDSPGQKPTQVIHDNKTITVLR